MAQGGGEMMNGDLVLPTVLLERLAEVIPTNYAYLLLYLVSKTQERGQDFLAVNYAVLGELVGLTKASIARGIKNLEHKGFIKLSLDDRHRNVVHVRNIEDILNGVKQERNRSETVAQQERNNSETIGSPTPPPTVLPDTPTSTSTSTPGTPPVVKSPPKKFKKPAPADVSTYAASIFFKLDGEEFCDFYESKGWMVGSNPMKDWKAAVRTWKKSAEPAKIMKPPAPPKPKEPEPNPEDLVNADDVHALVQRLAGGVKRIQ